MPSRRRRVCVAQRVCSGWYSHSSMSTRSPPALRRVYVRAWRRPPPGRTSGYAVGASWLLGVVAYLSLIGGLRAVVGEGVGLAVFALTALVAAMALWAITPWVMLGRMVRLRVLVPTGVLTGFAMTVYGATSSIWMPRTVSQNQDQFGFFGVALSMVTWLSGTSVIIVTCACATPVLAEDRGALGRLVRGRIPSLLRPGAASPHGPPLHAPGLSDAIGLGRDDDSA